MNGLRKESLQFSYKLIAIFSYMLFILELIKVDFFILSSFMKAAKDRELSLPFLSLRVFAYFVLLMYNTSTSFRGLIRL